jgi:hypothetical protein
MKFGVGVVSHGTDVTAQLTEWMSERNWRCLIPKHKSPQLAVLPDKVGGIDVSVHDYENAGR